MPKVTSFTVRASLDTGHVVSLTMHQPLGFANPVSNGAPSGPGEPLVAGVAAPDVASGQVSAAPATPAAPDTAFDGHRLKALAGLAQRFGPLLVSILPLFGIHLSQAELAALAALQTLPTS